MYLWSFTDINEDNYITENETLFEITGRMQILKDNYDYARLYDNDKKIIAFISFKNTTAIIEEESFYKLDDNERRYLIKFISNHLRKLEFKNGNSYKRIF